MALFTIGCHTLNIWTHFDFCDCFTLSITTWWIFNALSFSTTIRTPRTNLSKMNICIINITYIIKIECTYIWNFIRVVGPCSQTISACSVLFARATRYPIRIARNSIICTGCTITFTCLDTWIKAWTKMSKTIADIRPNHMTKRAPNKWSNSNKIMIIKFKNID